MKSKSMETEAACSEMANPAFIDPNCRNQLIAEAAYFRAESKGFPQGCALNDWLEAEAEIDRSYPVSKAIQ